MDALNYSASLMKSTAVCRGKLSESIVECPIMGGLEIPTSHHEVTGMKTNRFCYCP